MQAHVEGEGVAAGDERYLRGEGGDCTIRAGQGGKIGGTHHYALTGAVVIDHFEGVIHVVAGTRESDDRAIGGDDGGFHIPAVDDLDGGGLGLIPNVEVTVGGDEGNMQPGGRGGWGDGGQLCSWELVRHGGEGGDGGAGKRLDGGCHVGGNGVDGAAARQGDAAGNSGKGEDDERDEDAGS